MPYCFIALLHYLRRNLTKAPFCSVPAKVKKAARPPCAQPRSSRT
uniref:Uncharacterized protein n=1 Tax=Macrostomum lignano TaxID=282301 RepID=A0A1I8JDH2_9PLAT